MTTEGRKQDWTFDDAARFAISFVTDDPKLLHAELLRNATAKAIFDVLAGVLWRLGPQAATDLAENRTDALARQFAALKDIDLRGLPGDD